MVAQRGIIFEYFITVHFRFLCYTQAENMNPAAIKEKITRFTNVLMGLVTKTGEFFSVQLIKLGSFVYRTKKRAADSVPAHAKTHGFLAGKLNFMKSRFSRVFNLGHFPEGKRRPIFFAFCGLCVLFLILAISALALNSGKPKKNALPERMAGIPYEELFFPSEPDFLPKFLLEREPRPFWTVEDTRPYWKAPGNPEFWKGEIKTAVDKLLEGVP